MVGPGELLTYTLSITNAQVAILASGIVLTDTLPINTNFISASGTYALNGGQVAWSFPSLADGESTSAELVVQVAVDNCRNIENFEYEVSSDQTDQPLSGPTVNTPISNPFTYVLSPDHSAFITPGQVITFTHTLQNTGSMTSTVALSYSSSLGWASANLPVTATLAAGAQLILPIRIEVPSGALSNSAEEAILTASCIANPAVQVSNSDRVYYHLPLYFPIIKYQSP